MTKRSNKKNKGYTTAGSDEAEIRSLIKIVICVVAFFLLVWFAYAIYNGEIFGDKEEEKLETTIQNIEILAGSTFSVPEKEYMVLYYDFDGDYAMVYDLIRDNYVNSSAKALKMYKVNLGSKMNASYVAREGEKINTAPKNVTNLKVKEPTLIRIKNGKVVKYITGKDTIQKYVESLI